MRGKGKLFTVVSKFTPEIRATSICKVFTAKEQKIGEREKKIPLT